MTAGKPCNLTLTAASVPAIETLLTIAPALFIRLPSWPTAAREALGLFEEITRAACRLKRPVPLTNIPPDPAQLAKSCCSLAFGESIALNSFSMLGPPSEEKTVEVPKEATPCSSASARGRLAPTLPTPAASHEPPGNSPSCFAL